MAGRDTIVRANFFRGDTELDLDVAGTPSGAIVYADNFTGQDDLEDGVAVHTPGAAARLETRGTSW